jgi:hypothetical protein
MALTAADRRLTDAVEKNLANAARWVERQRYPSRQHDRNGDKPDDRRNVVAGDSILFIVTTAMGFAYGLARKACPGCCAARRRCGVGRS